MDTVLCVLAIGVLIVSAMGACVFLVLVIIGIEDDNAPKCWRDL